MTKGGSKPTGPLPPNAYAAAYTPRRTKTPCRTGCDSLIRLGPDRFQLKADRTKGKKEFGLTAIVELLENLIVQMWLD